MAKQKQNEKVNKSDIDQFVADEQEMSVRDVKGVTGSFLRQTMEMGGKFGEVDIHRFGTFYRKLKKARPERMGRNPKTGEQIVIKAKPARWVIKFKPWKKFRKTVAAYPVPAELVEDAPVVDENA